MAIRDVDGIAFGREEVGTADKAECLRAHSKSDLPSGPSDVDSSWRQPFRSSRPDIQEACSIYRARLWRDFDMLTPSNLVFPGPTLREESYYAVQESQPPGPVDMPVGKSPARVRDHLVPGQCES